MRNRTRWTLALLALVCILPVAASYGLFYLGGPGGTMNYGELIEPTPLPEGLAGLDGGRFDPAAIEGRWILAYAGPADCSADCEQALYYMRQVRTATGKNMDRVERLWLVTDGMTAPTAA